jgi:hypothetical protein
MNLPLPRDSVLYLRSNQVLGRTRSYQATYQTQHRGGIFTFFTFFAFFPRRTRLRVQSRCAECPAPEIR